jgi:hypothetical protein
VEKLHYETSVDRRLEVRAQRSRLLLRVLIAGAVFLTILSIGFGFIAYSIAHQDDASLTLTVVNHTGTPMDDAGFQGPYNTRTISVGRVAAGASVKKSIGYNVNGCPMDFSFDQNGKTFFASLAQGIEGDSIWTITVTPGG